MVLLCCYLGGTKVLCTPTSASMYHLLCTSVRIHLFSTFFHSSSRPVLSSRKPTHCTRSVRFRKPTSFAFSSGTPHCPAHAPTILPNGDRVLAGNVQRIGGRDRILVCRQKRKVPPFFFAHTDDLGQLCGTDVGLVVVAVRKKGHKDFHVVADRFARRFFVVRDRNALWSGWFRV